MRPPVDADRVQELARELARALRTPVTLYLTGGSTAVLEGWRPSTAAIDLRLEPETDELMRRLSGLKDELDYGEAAEQLFRYPAIDPASLARRVADALPE